MTLRSGFGVIVSAAFLAVSEVVSVLPSSITMISPVNWFFCRKSAANSISAAIFLLSWNAGIIIDISICELY